MLAKAKLIEIKWNASQQAEVVPGGNTVDVDFNPQTLKLNYANENKGGEQPAGGAKQFVGSSSSKLSLELLFDTTITGTDTTIVPGSDVRKKTRQIIYYIKPKTQPAQDNKRVPPAVRFQWGNFTFDGVINSLDETLDYFSEDGVPLRSTVSLTLTRQDIDYLPIPATPASGSAPATGATAPLTPARGGDSVQGMLGRLGVSADWKAVASANNIDDPLRLSAGTLIDVNASVSVNANISFDSAASDSVSKMD